MEWNPKCDWDNLIAFNSKASESVQLADWGIEDEGEIGGGSFELSGIRGSSGGSGSDLGHGSSVKSSKSASTDSSPKEGMKASSFVFERFEGSPGAIIKKTVPPRAADQFRVPSPLEASVVSVEQLIGLKLGKRTYFENNSGGSSIKSPSFSDVPVSSTSAVKKTKSSSQNATIPRCQVEGCNLDLSSAKDYHRKHRVCDNHSKCPKVTVAGVELRFCQQCSRFHSLVEFDEKKRSCRRRLSDHNARRRKPRQETIQFNTPKLSSPFYDGRQQMNFSLNNGESVGNPIWKNACSSKFTLTEHFPLKPEKVGQPPFPRIELPYAMHSKSCNELLAPKSTAADVLKQGFKESISSNLDAAPEFPRALSLLSTNSWASSEPESISFDHPLHANPSAVALSVIPQGLPLASPEHWQIEPQSSTHLHTFTGSSNNGGHFQEIHLFKPLNQSNVFSNSWN